MYWLEILGSYDGGLTLLPPVVAIFLAYATNRVAPSLGIAAVVAALVASEGDLFLSAQRLFAAFWEAASSKDNLIICGFSMCVAAMVGVMGRSGGTRGMVVFMARRAKGRRSTMVVSWLAGALVFFDDYANCLVVGSAMGPLCDKNGVSRAKLAYIVDSTAAPLASLAIVSTWVGYEVGLVGTATGDTAGAFPLFLNALPYRFYCILTLVCVGAVAISGRDFGPMRKVEAQCEPVFEELTEDSAENKAWLAIVPVAVLLLGTGVLLFSSGYSATTTANPALFEIIGNSDPFQSMALASFAGLLTAIVLSTATRSTTIKSALTGAWSATRTVLAALVVLFLAWTLGGLMKETQAVPFLTSILQERLDPSYLPTLVFLLAGVTAFSTGSSFFTMGALIPLVVPLAMHLDPSMGPLFLAALAAVLDGAVFGDHASPLSDTTILSSLGSQVDVTLHVKTQLPYAMLVATTVLVTCTLPIGFGSGWWVCLLLGTATIITFVYTVGRVPEGKSEAGNRT